MARPSILSTPASIIPASPMSNRFREVLTVASYCRLSKMSIPAISSPFPTSKERNQNLIVKRSSGPHLVLIAGVDSVNQKVCLRVPLQVLPFLPHLCTLYPNHLPSQIERKKSVKRNWSWNFVAHVFILSEIHLKSEDILIID